MRLYDGRGRLPYENGAFGTVFASEVLEHIPNWSATLAELARCTMGNLIVTVPNLAAIPLLASNYVVPWHFLEADHKNFFNITSLALALREHFSDLQIFQLHYKVVNGVSYYVSVGVVATGKRGT